MSLLKNLGYMIRRLFGMNYKAMLQKITSIHQKTGRSRLWIMTDMLRCATNYGAGYMDYDLFEMYNLTPQQRDTYITRGRNNALIKQYNDPAYGHILRNKGEFNARFQEFVHRDWTYLSQKESALDFMSRHCVFMAKPMNGTCGKGIEKIYMQQEEGAEAVWQRLSANGEYLLEEVIRQHPQVSAIYPDAINTVRTVTIRKDGVTHVICTYFRIGNHGNHVDNFNSGGMVAPVDEKTGIVADRAIDKNKNLYATHPMTGTPIQGFQFPDWEIAMDMVRKAATLIPQIGYLGWDIAFTENGPVLVEGNEFPGHDIYQLPEHTPDKIGIMPKFRI